MTNYTGKSRTIYIPGPYFYVHLSAQDALHPVHYSRRLLIFRCEDLEQWQVQLRSLEVGLRQLLRRCPVLGGEVVTSEEGVHAIHHRNAGLELVIRDLRKTLPSYQTLEKENFPPSILTYDFLMPIPLDIGNTSPVPACMVQLTPIQGGSIISWAMSHSVADGRGTDVLMSLLSENVKNAMNQVDQVPLHEALASEEQVGMDRSAIREVRCDVPFDIARHPAYSARPSLPTSLGTIQSQSSPPQTPLTSIVLSLSRDGLERLKTACQPDPESEIKWVSSHDAICALLWRIHVMTCGDPGEERGTTKIFFPSDARRHLGLDAGWIPNAVYQVTASIPLNDMRGMEEVTALRIAAKAVRRALTSINSEDVKSYFKHLENVGWVDWGFLSMSPVDFAMGTDWSSAVYEDGWGKAFGPLRSWRYPGELGGIRMGAVLPRRTDGSVEVMLKIGEDQVELVRRMCEAWV
jgi:hypothetical protein